MLFFFIGILFVSARRKVCTASYLNQFNYQHESMLQLQLDLQFKLKIQLNHEILFYTKFKTINSAEYARSLIKLIEDKFVWLFDLFCVMLINK